MTLVLALNSWEEISIVADCRLTVPLVGPSPPQSTSQDICQKVAILNDWSVIGLAGHICLGRFVWNAFANRIQNTPIDGAAWLRDKEEVQRFLSDTVTAHATVRLEGNHRACCHEHIQILIAWVDHALTFAGEPRDHKDPNAPLPLSQMLVLSSPSMSVRSGGPNIAAIGNGSEIVERMRDDTYMDIAWFAKENREHGWMHRAFMTMKVAMDMVEDAGIDGVGGLYQLISLAPAYASVIPYFYWVDVAPGFGTYVAMRMKDGRWLQEHRPSGTRVRILAPYEVQLRHPQMLTSHMFDPRLTLTKDSPGVVPRRQGQLVFHPYIHNDVPDEIIESWGNEPIEPFSWEGRRVRYRV